MNPREFWENNDKFSELDESGKFESKMGIGPEMPKFFSRLRGIKFAKEPAEPQRNGVSIADALSYRDLRPASPFRQYYLPVSVHSGTGILIFHYSKIAAVHGGFAFSNPENFRNNASLGQGSC